jgi:hypothetical protein
MHDDGIEFSLGFTFSALTEEIKKRVVMAVSIKSQMKFQIPQHRILLRRSASGASIRFSLAPVFSSSVMECVLLKYSKFL